MSHSDEAAPLLPGLKPVLELLSSDPQRIDCIFCKKGLRGPEAQAIQALCRERRSEEHTLNSSHVKRSRMPSSA